MEPLAQGHRVRKWGSGALSPVCVCPEVSAPPNPHGRQLPQDQEGAQGFQPQRSEFMVGIRTGAGPQELSRGVQGR